MQSPVVGLQAEHFDIDGSLLQQAVCTESRNLLLPQLLHVALSSAGQSLQYGTVELQHAVASLFKK